MDVSDYKCLSCNANLQFDPVSQKWTCAYCGSLYSLEQLEKAYGSDNNLKEDQEVKLNTDFDCYSCPNCGAEIIMDDTTTATFCVYCGSTAIIKNKLKGEFNPTKIIPFKKTKDEAIKAFEEYKKGKLFMPDEFTNKNNIEKISGVYIPFFIYDCDIKSAIRMDATKVQHWSDSSYSYTKTDFFTLDRCGTMHFEDIPVDGSSKFPDDIMNSIEPFDYKELLDFSPSYLSGFLSERFDISMDELFEIAKNRAIQSSEDTLYNTTTSYATKKITTRQHALSKKNTSEYVLLPVWMLNVNFEGKMYTFAMNGQTGKFIGNVPVSKKKFWKWWRRIFAGCLATTSILTILFNLL